jgi:hypothetical protein
MPEDIGGLPYRGKIGDVETTFFAPLARLARLCQEGAYGVLVLDDLPTASQAVQCAERKLVLDRRAGEAKLSPGVLVIVTGNRREDKSAATTLPAHFRNSVCILDIQPDVEQWREWYGQQSGHEAIIGSFLQFKPAHFSQLPKENDQRGAFATPRQWTALGRLYSIAQRSGVLLDVAAGLVGEGPATEFMAFVNIRSQLVNPDEVLRDPQRALPDPKSVLSSPDRAFALATGIGEVAAMWRKSDEMKKKKEAPLQLLRALGWVTVGNREYIATAVSTYTSNGGHVNDLIQAAKTNMNDDLVKATCQFLHKTFHA